MPFSVVRTGELRDLQAGTKSWEARSRESHHVPPELRGAAFDGAGDDELECVGAVVVGAEGEVAELVQQRGLAAAELEAAGADQRLEAFHPGLLVGGVVHRARVEADAAGAGEVLELADHDLLELV